MVADTTILVLKGEISCLKILKSIKERERKNHNDNFCPKLILEERTYLGTVFIRDCSKGDVDYMRN